MWYDLVPILLLKFLDANKKLGHHRALNYSKGVLVKPASGRPEQTALTRLHVCRFLPFWA